nr:ADP-ribosylglycohydrolase family protein [Erythrobacter sp. SG61-1L]
MHGALRCEAITLGGDACRSPAVKGKKRCHVHGGLGSKDKSFGRQFGDYAKAALAREKQINAQIKKLDKVIRKMERDDAAVCYVDELMGVRRGLLKIPQQTQVELTASHSSSSEDRAAESDDAAKLGHAVRRSPARYRTHEIIHTRARGAMLGLAVGDALGTTLTGRARDSYRVLTGMLGGGPLGLSPGEWTGNTAMALALMDSLTFRRCLDEIDLMERFVEWQEEGVYSCTGSAIGIGETMQEALARYRQTEDPLAGLTHSEFVDNGSLVRLAPVAIRYWNDPVALSDVAARQSRTTHGAPEAAEACEAFAHILADAIGGMERHKVLRRRYLHNLPSVEFVMEGSWKDRSRGQLLGTNHFLHTLEAALWCVERSSSFEEAVLCAANLGEQASATAAVAGQLAGAIYGASAIPGDWLACLAWRERIAEMAARLIEQSLTSMTTSQ